MEPRDQQPSPFSPDVPGPANPPGPKDQPLRSTQGSTSKQSASPPHPPASPSPRRGYAIWLGIATLTAAGVVAGALQAGSSAPEVEAEQAAVTIATVAPTVSSPTATTLATQPVVSAPALRDASAVGDAVIPSVVTVQVLDGAGTRRGSGSGIVYDGQGHVVTNSHVVAAGATYEVVLSDLRVYPAELVGTDPTTDLAILSITAEKLTPISFGDSDALTVGAPAIAVGSPLGLDGGPSLTVGVISALGREVRTGNTITLYGMLQTDAPITQGSSGGALVDGQGRLVGITTAVGVSEVGIEGIGFATPVEVVTRVADEIIADGGASNPYLGISGATSFVETSDGGTAPIGVFIDSVEPNTAASVAGFSEGDVIAAINGDTVKTMDQLIALLRRYGAGSEIIVSLDGGSTIAVTLGERPDA